MSPATETRSIEFYAARLANGCLRASAGRIPVAANGRAIPLTTIHSEPIAPVVGSLLFRADPGGYGRCDLDIVPAQGRVKIRATVTFEVIPDGVEAGAEASLAEAEAGA